MKQILKETIILWIVIILALVSICILIGVPLVFLPYIGIRGELQVLVSALWLICWLSFVGFPLRLLLLEEWQKVRDKK